MARPTPKRTSTNPRPPQPLVYDLQVSILQGPMTDAFLDANPDISRTLRIRGDQTLAQLHDAIFKAFDRFDAHMYEFQVGGKGPMDPKARRYVLRLMGEDDPIGRPAGTVDQTTIDALGLKRDAAFAYWFDFGDDWWHQVTVLDIRPPDPGVRYPKLIASTGASPPQYPDPDEDE